MKSFSVILCLSTLLLLLILSMFIKHPATDHDVFLAAALSVSAVINSRKERV